MSVDIVVCLHPPKLYKVLSVSKYLRGCPKLYASRTQRVNNGCSGAPNCCLCIRVSVKGLSVFGAGSWLKIFRLTKTDLAQTVHELYSRKELNIGCTGHRSARSIYS